MLVVPYLLPGSHFLSRGGKMGNATVQALPSQDGEFDFLFSLAGALIRALALIILGAAYILGDCAP